MPKGIYKHRPLSKQHKKRIRLRMLGNKFGFKKGYNPWMKGKHHTEEAKEKLRKANLGKKQSKEGIEKRRIKCSGEKHYNWQGGKTELSKRIRESFKYRLWRSDVFTRDNFKCVNCGETKSGSFNADHIEPMAKIMFNYNIKTIEEAMNCDKLWDINNGRTLCVKCHYKTESYGIKSKHYCGVTVQKIN